MDVVTKDKIIAALLWLFSVVYLYGGMKLKIGGVTNPGPGFQPLVVGVLLFVCTAINLYHTLHKVKTGESTGVSRQAAIIGVLTVVYIPLLIYTGFLLSTSVVMFGMLRVLAYKSRLVSLVSALFIAVCSYIVFTRMLGVVLPDGIIEEFLYSIGW